MTLRPDQSLADSHRVFSQSIFHLCSKVPDFIHTRNFLDKGIQGQGLSPRLKTNFHFLLPINTGKECKAMRNSNVGQIFIIEIWVGASRFESPKFIRLEENFLESDFRGEFYLESQRISYSGKIFSDQSMIYEGINLR